MNALYVILITVTIQGSMFEIYTIVSEIHDNVDLVLGALSMRVFKFKFFELINTSFLQIRKWYRQKKKKHIKVGIHLQVSFQDKIIRLLGHKTLDTLTLKVKFERSRTFVEVKSIK